MAAVFTELASTSSATARITRERVLAGEYFLVRGAMTRLGLLEPLRSASLRGVSRELGPHVAAQLAEAGFENFHSLVLAQDVPRVTESAYQEVLDVAPGIVAAAVRGLLDWNAPFYFEPYPNVRFHIPYDLAAAHRKSYEAFGKRRGEGKITAHGPHRDSWLDCPSNAINIWVAIGPVEVGNGMVVYPDAYRGQVARARDGCQIDAQSQPGVPTRFRMEPGDAFVFHGDHLHASSLNYTEQTRHVISFRLTLGRPRFAGVHLHNYAYSPLALALARPLGRRLRWLSLIPAKLTPGYVRTQLGRVGEKLTRARAPRASREVASPARDGLTTLRAAEHGSALPLEPGQLRALDSQTCIARLTDGSLVTFSRRCTHEGADLSLGHLDGDRVRCPWHGVPFELRSGRSPCSSLRPLRVACREAVPVRVEERAEQGMPREEAADGE
ncbi:MAG: ferredoxin subunit of nitrite reductase and ring-hydroxylating dioxygenase [Myxococcaceae bacterium]|nr:ferredoxin subunit of nitrite reductase and ring-hydroxylating dioxygenase [Myxococcaceae bacterium]